MPETDYRRAILMFVAFLFSICFHEFAHAWMANRKGDNTAKLMGRLTLNPMAHADLVGTIILPIMGLFGAMVFGWAKPVPVNPSNLKNKKEDMFWIAAAGPGSNMLLAFVGVLALIVAFNLQIQVIGIYTFIDSFITVNLMLCFFNLIPLHPLDGGTVLARFLPDSWGQKLEEMQMYSTFILFALFLSGGLKYIGYPILWTKGLLLGFAEGFIP